jgi:iron complex outermembrane receptor protein
VRSIFPGRTPPLALIRRTAAAAALLAVLLPAAVRAQAAGRVEGRIVTADGDPVAGATVRVDGGQAVATDAAGRFVIPGVPSGPHTVTASRVGLADATQAILVSADGAARVELRLGEGGVLLAPVVVSATREVRRLGETPATVGVVAGRELRDARPTHPAEVMGRIPGVWVSGTGGEGHTTAIRQPKTTNPVYLYLEDGVPTRSTGFFNHNALYEMDVPQAERVEVLKGPATALYGSDAIGGVINVETRAPSARPTAEAFLEGGRAGWTRLLASAGGMRGADGVRADVNVTHTDGWRDGTGYGRQGGNLRWDRQLGAGASLRTLLAVSHIDQHTAGASTLAADDFAADPRLNYTPISFRRITAVRLSGAFERRGASSLFSVTPFARWNRMDILPDWSLSYDPTVYRSAHHSAGLLAKWRRDFAPMQSRVITGVDVDYSPGMRREDLIKPTRSGRFYTAYDRVSRVYDYDVTFHGVSPYVQAEAAPVAGVRVTGGLRYDHLGYSYRSRLDPLETGKYRRPADTDRGFDHLSPKLGVTWEASPALGVFASYAHGFRVPSEGQLFRQGAAVNTVGLNPVRADSYEGGARGQVAGRVDYSLSAYRMRVRDDVLAYVAPDGTRETVNAGETLHRGVEAGLGMVLTRALRADVSWSRARHTYRRWQPKPTVDFGGHEIESAPRDIGSARLAWTPARRAGARFEAEWMHVGSYWMDPENTHRYAGHDLLNLHASTPVGRGLELVARLNNVADKHYAETAQYTVSAGEQFAPGLPRSLYAGVQYRWGK